MIFFPDSSCNDSGKTFMAVRKIYHKHTILVQSGFFDQTNGIFFSLLSHCLSALIQSHKISRQFCRFFLIPFTQKFQWSCSCVKTSAGIDARTKNKSYMICRNFRSLQLICTNECTKSRRMCHGKPAQAFFYDNPVFSLQIHNISNRSHSSQFCKFQHFTLQNPWFFI